MTAPTRPAGTETPLTDALFSRHSDETNALCREGAMPSGWHGHGVKQAIELLQHARQLERDLHAAQAKALDIEGVLHQAWAFAKENANSRHVDGYRKDAFSYVLFWLREHEKEPSARGERCEEK